MGLQYGQGLAEQTLRYLSSTENPLYRLMKGSSEIDVAESEDATPENFKRIKGWQEKYGNASLPDYPRWREFQNDKDMIYKIDDLIEELVNICCDMIESTSKSEK